jgi:hypothetical protein
MHAASNARGQGLLVTDVPKLAAPYHTLAWRWPLSGSPIQALSCPMAGGSEHVFTTHSRLAKVAGVRLGSFASDRHATRLRGMSAVPPIATELLRRRERRDVHKTGREQ